MRGRRRALAFCRAVILLGVCGFAIHAWCQQSPQPVVAEPEQGSIHGVVTDGSGAARELATVELASAAQTVRTAVSGSNGAFEFSGVPSGAFKLTISLNGFAPKTIAGVLHAGESYEAQGTVLVVATASSNVQVTASETEIAQEQFREEEKQRVLGIIPNYYVSYVPHPPVLTAKQKFSLALKTEFDPISFLATGAFAGIQQATNSWSGYGQGMRGYARRYGAGFADGFDNTMIGSALLPWMLKQDPRYFYKGTGTTRSRILYAIANSVVCKGDNGHWQPDYSGILGGLAAGGISNLYYPANDRSGAALTFENAGLAALGGVMQNLFQEFLVRKLTPRLPNYGGLNP